MQWSLMSVTCAELTCIVCIKSVGAANVLTAHTATQSRVELPCINANVCTGYLVQLVHYIVVRRHEIT